MLKPHQNFETTLKTYKNGKYKQAIGFKFDATAKDKNLENTKQNSAWRKKCKGGLYYCIFVLEKTVHFCLGAAEKSNGLFVELDHKQVVNKKDPYDRDASPDTNLAKLRVITPAELRWIYRNRTAAEVQKRVQFWKPADKDGEWEACCAPWSKDADDNVKNHWESYKPKSESPHEKKD